MDRHDDKVYYSDRCKVKISRDRRKAQLLRDKKTPYKDIAEQLGYDVATVKGWFPSKRKED